jgi:FMN-dependent oxidoreductase (nitrilotriacetate monooxygenase family)
MTKKLIINATKMITPGHLAFGLWRLSDPVAPQYTELRYWTELACLLEDGGFDSLFLADALGQLDSYRGSADPALVTATQTPLDDPLLVVPAMATVTRTLGFGVTVSTTYEQPYLLARKFTTLDHLTSGRIGWNIVTSQLDSAARNLGYDRQVPHDERYEIAQEFLEVTCKLWEGSWDAGAVVRDRLNGVYADPGRVHAIGHSGKYFSVPSAHLSEPSVQRTPLIFQAGTSPRGKLFAARNAEVVFVTGFSPRTLKRNIDEIKSLAAGFGRAPGSIKFITSAVVITGKTDSAADRKLREYQKWYSVEGALTHFSSVTGIDWSSCDLDAPLSYLETDSNRSILASLTKNAPAGEEWTLRKFIAPKDGISYGGISIIGDGEAAASSLEALAEEAGLDGFNLAAAHSHESFADLAEHVMPVLARRGRLREKIPGRSLREATFDGGSALLPADHPASAYRNAFQDEPSSAPPLPECAATPSGA